MFLKNVMLVLATGSVLVANLITLGCRAEQFGELRGFLAVVLKAGHAEIEQGITMHKEGDKVQLKTWLNKEAVANNASVDLL